jgi:tetratricopeptide (TPR) repeat protein
MFRWRKAGVFFLGFIPVALAFTASNLASFQAPIPPQQESTHAYDLGMRLLREKRYQEALEQFKSLEYRSPQLPQGYTGEGIALALMGKPEASIQALKKALDIDHSFWVARRELGIVYWQLNQKDQAAKELGDIVELFPDDPAVNLLLGQYEFERANYRQASAHFGKAHVQIAADAGLSLMAAEAQLKSGMKAPAREALEALAASPALSPQQRFHLGWLLEEAGDYPSSIHVLQSLPDDYADQFGRSYGIALAYYEDGQFANCIGTLSDLKNRKILRPELFSLLGAAEESNHNTVDAYNAFREGIYTFPNDDQNYLNIATLSAQHFNYELATEILTSGIRLIPNDYKLYLTRAVVHTLSRQLQIAQADFEKAVAIAPEQGDAYLGLGICYMDEDRIDDATGAFRQGVRQQPKDVTLQYFLADSLFRKGITPGTPAYAEAISAVETSLSLEPRFAHGYLQRGRLELLNHEAAKAVVDLETARSLAPDSREIAYQLAVAYRTVGKKAEAEKLFSMVTEASENDAAEFRTGQLRDMIITLSNSAHRSN